MIVIIMIMIIVLIVMLNKKERPCLSIDIAVPDDALI